MIGAKPSFQEWPLWKPVDFRPFTRVYNTPFITSRGPLCKGIDVFTMLGFAGLAFDFIMKIREPPF